ncbi:MAG: segregation/condensation protein A [Ruminococcus sp.]|nr:segregation/condensation protein A [Ruminococcus sp.]
MESISFKLETFEGPLDLLLHLVTKHKLNIYDIEISLLLEQYLTYIEGLDVKDYEQAADFLEMAARLIYIKTCYLLPQPEEAEELKKELQGSLIEYSVCKLAAQMLRESYAGGLIFVREPVKLPVNKQYTREHDKQELFDAYTAISSKVKEYKPLRATMFSPIVSHRIVSVESKITDILHRLFSVGHFDMSALYDGMEDRSERIAAFLAVLELTKSGRICLNDDNTVIELRAEPREGDPPFDDNITISVSEPLPAEEDKPAESEPLPAAEDKPAQSEPLPAVEDKPAQSEPLPAAEDKPAQSDPLPAAEDKPAESEPLPAVEDKPAESEPLPAAEDKPAESEPLPAVEDKPAESEPLPAEEDKPAESEPLPAEEDKPAESEPLPAVEDKPAESEPLPEDKPVKPFSVQLALTSRTVMLIEPPAEREAIPAFAPIELPEATEGPAPEEPTPAPEEASETPGPQEDPPAERVLSYAEADAELETLIRLAGFTEPPAAEFKPNYYGRRYYWGRPPFEAGERSYSLAMKLRK